MPAPYSRERVGFAALVLLVLGPVVLQGLWRPLARAVEVEVDAYRLTCSSLVVVAVVLFAHVGTASPSVQRWLPGASGAVAAALVGVVLGDSPAAMAAVTAALCGVVAGCAALFPWLLSRLPAALDGLAAGRPVAAVGMVLAGLAAVIVTTRIATFMGDASRADLSLIPDVAFFVHHSCLTAYVEGTRLAVAGVDNVYLADRWPDLNGTPREESYNGPYSPFSLDAFAYPPPFLLLPRVLLSWLGDFASQRALWFSFNGLALAAGLWTVATWLGDRVGPRALLLGVFVWITPAILTTLQTGNVHLTVMVAAMLALVAFETRRPALGGALLAFAIVSKLSPGILLIVLLGRRRFREVAWTAGFALGFLGLSVLAFGTAPLVDFVTYQLPGLSSGEMLSFLAEPETVPLNYSPFGIPFKLAFLGAEVGDPWTLARLINRAYTLALVGLVVVGARTERGPRATAEVWAAVLTLSALQSPLAPAYAAFPLFWLLSLRAIEVRGTARALGFATIWALIAIIPPLSARGLVAWTLLQQVLVLGLSVYCLLRASSLDTPAAPSSVARAA